MKEADESTGIFAAKSVSVLELFEILRNESVQSWKKSSHLQSTIATRSVMQKKIDWCLIFD